MNMDIKFSIVIPTRERCDTLYWTLMTCVSQQYENLEIIVSDNFSQDGTKDMVHAFKDHRIRYVNTGRRLDMSSNWEFGLSHVTGDFAMVLGDDNGLLPGALRELSSIIMQTNCEAISWGYACYLWPSNVISDTSTISVPLKSGLFQRDSRKMLEDLLGYKCNYGVLPCIYKAFVSVDAINSVKKQSGKFFQSMIPDAYSAIALACVMDTYYYSEKPFSIDGISQHSGGTSYFSGKGESSKQFLSEENIAFDERLVMAPSFAIIQAESFLQAQKYLQGACVYKVNIQSVINQAIEEVRNTHGYARDKVLKAVKEIALINHLGESTDKLLEALPNHKAARLPLPPIFGYNFKAKCMTLNCDELGVENIFSASLVCSIILSLKKNGYLSPFAVVKTTIKLVLRKLSGVFGRTLI